MNLPKIILSGLFAAAAGMPAVAQDSTYGYGFLNIPTSSHVFGLGGNNIALIEEDVNLADQNPALIGPELEMQVAGNYMLYMSTGNFAGVRFGMGAGDHSAWAFGVRYLNYGKFDGYDEFGTPTGSFTPSDAVIEGTYSRDITDRWRGGVNFKMIYSGYERYEAFAMAADLGVNYYNKVIFEQDEKEQKKFRRQSDAYFDAASLKLEEVLANDPLSMKYLKALAVTYGCLGNLEKFGEVNTRIRALGETPVSEKDLPSEVTANEGNVSNFASASGNSKGFGKDAPLYSDFAKAYVEERLGKWVAKGEFEKVEDYQQRVNDIAVKSEYERLCKEAEREYLTLYTKQLRPKDFQLKPYDAGNEVYLIESNFGPVYLPVPLENGEAEIFKANWDRMKLHNPHYYIDKDKVLIAGVTFMTPYDKSYTYDNEKAVQYARTAVDVDFNRILADANKDVVKPGSPYTGPVNVARVTVRSDVDENIPISGKKADRTFAVIIANEVYANVPKVESALNDGEVFSRYLNLTLGLPKENIRVYRNAGLAQMHRAFADIRNITKAVDGADVIFYYAGHGMPDEATKNAFLLPVDGDALVSETCLSLNKIYTDLGSMGANSVMVFLDACFSGSQRNDSGMLNAARSVVIKAKDAAPQGNMFSFTATSGQETALPYKEKNHGLFTYFLLKKLQESKGNVTLRELTEYVTDNVKRQSTITNGKPQTPTVTTSGAMAADWHKRKLSF